MINCLRSGLFCLACTAVSMGIQAQHPLAINSPADTIRLQNELTALYDIGRLPQYLPGAYSAQVSSYDLSGGNDDGFSGKNSFVRRNADSSLVIFDIKGCGVINRIWTPTPTEDTLDFYLDGNSKPALTIKYSDLFSGKTKPFTAPLCGNDLGGFYCYFPILFNSGCRIVCRGKQLQFHQIQYRLYPPGSAAESFSAALPDTSALNTIAALWAKEKKSLGDFRNLVRHDKPAGKISRQFDLLPGKTATIFSAVTGGRIEGIEFSPAGAFEGLDKLVDLEISWDDDALPAVDCPLADFFGYAFGKQAMQSLLLGSDNDVDYCYLPMPYDKKATIRLRYRQPQNGLAAPALRIHSTVYYSGTARHAATEGRFYTSWNRLAADGQPHVFLNTKGSGHYIGTVLQAQGLNPGMTYFFEGDDSTVVDGTLRMHGTGSEDYFNGGWYAMLDRWAGKLSLPLHGCLAYSLPYAHTGAYRFYLSDKIAFNKSIFHSIEHGPEGNHIPVDYTSLGLYYAGTAPASHMVPTNVLSKVYVPDTLIMYPQLMSMTIENDLSFTGSWKYNTGGISYTYTANNDAGLHVSMAELPMGKYRLLMDFVRNDQGAEFSIWQGQHLKSNWLSTHAPTEQIEKNYFVAAVQHTVSVNGLTIRFKTAPGKDKLVVNRLIFVKLNNAMAEGNK